MNQIGHFMSILRRGITGFDTEMSVDFRAFKTAVYSAMRAAGGMLIEVVDANEPTPSFHHADITYQDRELSVLCSRTFPVVAFVERPIKMSGVRPVDLPQLAGVIRELGFEVASAAELDRPFNKEDVAVLSEGERQQVKYWKPQRIAELVFNWWD